MQDKEIKYFFQLLPEDKWQPNIPLTTGKLKKTLSQSQSFDPAIKQENTPEVNHKNRKTETQTDTKCFKS